MIIIVMIIIVMKVDYMRRRFFYRSGEFTIFGGGGFISLSSRLFYLRRKYQILEGEILLPDRSIVLSEKFGCSI